METVEVALPEDFQSVGIVIVGEVRDQQVQMSRQVALPDAHLPVVVILLVAVPFQTDMVVLHIFYKVCLSHVLFGPGLSPGEFEYAVLFRDVVCQPSLQTVSTTDLLPNDVGRLGVQRVFYLYFCLHIMSICLVIHALGCISTAQN